MSDSPKKLHPAAALLRQRQIRMLQARGATVAVLCDAMEHAHAFAVHADPEGLRRMWRSMVSAAGLADDGRWLAMFDGENFDAALKTLRGERDALLALAEEADLAMQRAEGE